MATCETLLDSRHGPNVRSQGRLSPRKQGASATKAERSGLEVESLLAGVAATLTY